MFVGSKMAALGELELRVRRSQQTARVSEKAPRAKAVQEDQRAELAKMHEELKMVAALKKDLDGLLPILELPLRKRFLMVASKDTYEADITALCAFLPHPPLLVAAFLIPSEPCFRSCLAAGVRTTPRARRSWLGSRQLRMTLPQS